MHYIAKTILLFFLLTPTGLLAQQAGEKRIALVIGNSKYASAPLRNPVNDANAMAKKLREMGFEVILRTDIGQRQMNRAITEFGEKLALGSVGLFYYAGHGMQARGKNYLVPVDAEITTEGSVSTESVDVERVLDQLTPARLSMVILDACRNNPFERRFRSGAGRGLAQIDAPAGTLIAYATAPGKVALDGEGAHGTYTEALLQAIEKPGLRVEDVFKQVRIDVLKATANQQIPWESSSLTGDFLFRPAKVVIPDQREQQKAEQDAAVLREQMKSLSAEMAKLRETRAAPDPNLARQEQERKKAEQEAAALRDQMALLRAEITKVRESRPAPGSSPVTRDQDQKKVEQEAAALRDQMALMAAEISKLRDNRPASGANPIQNAQEQKKAEKETAAAREQLAMLNAEISKLEAGPAALKTGTGAEAETWKKQIAKLEAARGKLTLASAMATLLNIPSGDAARVQAFESEAGRRPHSSAMALGVDASGSLVWGGSHSQANRTYASDIALDFCAGVGGTKCKAVIVNGSFVEDAWFEVVKQLGSQPVEAVRKAFMSGLAQPIVENVVGQRMHSAGRPIGFTFSRSPSQ